VSSPFKSQEMFAPLPSTEGPMFVYVAPEVANDGPAAPDMEVLAARGWVVISQVFQMLVNSHMTVFNYLAILVTFRVNKKRKKCTCSLSTPLPATENCTIHYIDEISVRGV